MEERIEYLRKNDLYDELRTNDPEFLESLISGESEGKRPGSKSRDQTCILTFLDSKENLYVKPTCVGAIGSRHLEELRGKFKKANTLVTDGEDSYRSLAKSENLVHQQVLSDERKRQTIRLCYKKCRFFSGVFYGTLPEDYLTMAAAVPNLWY